MEKGSFDSEQIDSPEQDATEIEHNQNEKFPKPPRTALVTSKSVKLGKVMEAAINPLGLTQAEKLNKAMEAAINPLGLTQARRINKAMEVAINPSGLTQARRISKAMEASISSLGLTQAGRISKAMEASTSSLGLTQAGRISKAMEASISSLGLTQAGKISKAMEVSISSLGLNQAGRISKAMETSISSLGLTQAGRISKAMEASISSLGLNQAGRISKAMEASISSLGLTQAVKFSSAFKDLNVEVLLDELRGRDDFTEDSFPNVETPTQHVRIEEHTTSSSIVVKEARGEKAKPNDLSSIPTWLLWLWINILLSSFAFANNWESLREGISDINSRLPQTESFYEIRNFIRTAFSGKPGDIRLVKGSNVNLRENPSMKSDVILQLPNNTAVVVLGKEDRTWLLVSYEHEGYVLDGYISTKLLRKVKKH
ncbi:SH3 domain-containing protein [Pseudomonas silesiensis]|uniref:SH3 domain-containing protein n=1 Tax=Pseudomonas silesiensis TaxID=1853130 RepID=UPI0030CAE675